MFSRVYKYEFDITLTLVNLSITDKSGTNVGPKQPPTGFQQELQAWKTQFKQPSRKHLTVVFSHQTLSIRTVPWLSLGSVFQYITFKIINIALQRHTCTLISIGLHQHRRTTVFPAKVTDWTDEE